MEKVEFAIGEKELAQMTTDFVSLGEKRGYKPYELAIILKLSHDLLAEMMGLSPDTKTKKVYKG